jgi:hypothetical protein
MGLKGYRLWAMGQLDSTCRAPPISSLYFPLRSGRRLHLKGHVLNPGLIFKGERLKPVAFKLWVNNRVASCTAPAAVDDAVEQRAARDKLHDEQHALGLVEPLLHAHVVAVQVAFESKL